MRRVLVLLPALLALQVGVSPALAWAWPADGPVLQQFSYDAASPYESGRHRGIDIGGSPGSTVVAPAAGTVSFAGTVPDLGLSLTIQTPDGYSVTLVHLGAISVGRGEAIGERSPVGSIDPSGTAEVGEPHVHLGVRVTSEPEGYVDPLLLLPPRADDVPQDPGPPVEANALVGEAGPQTAPIDVVGEPGAGAEGTPAEPRGTSGEEGLEEPGDDGSDAAALEDGASQPQAATEETPIVEVPDLEGSQPIASSSNPTPVAVLVEPVAGSPDRADPQLPQSARLADAESPAPSGARVEAPPTPVAMPSPLSVDKAGTKALLQGRETTAPNPDPVSGAASSPPPAAAKSAEGVAEATAVEVVSPAPLKAAVETVEPPPGARADHGRAIDRRSRDAPPAGRAPSPAPTFEGAPPGKRPGAQATVPTPEGGSRVPLLVGAFLLGAVVVGVLSRLRGGAMPVSIPRGTPAGNAGAAANPLEDEAVLDRELEMELACLLAEDRESAGEIRVLVEQGNR